MLTSNDIPLAASPIDRAAHHRTDAAWLEAAYKRDDVLIFLMKEGLPLVDIRGDGLIWLGPEVARLGATAQTVFLGLDKAGAPVFGAEMPDTFQLQGSLLEGAGSFEDMRLALGKLPAMQSNLAATARSLFEWHRNHPFCAKCGSQTEVAEAGWKRVCPNCGAQHFPRTDPVAIMLAVKDDQCLLGRQAGWPADFWSCLAGFVEPGESIEQAASRELLEEAGIRADPASAEYLFCQPWPFPSSLMIGIILQAENMDYQVEQDELEAARWVTRAEARDILAGKHPDIRAPFPFAVASHILQEWAGRDH